MLSPKWLEEIHDVVSRLAESLHKYAKYLVLQNEAHHHASTPACSTRCYFSVYLFLSQSTLETLSPVYHALVDKQHYEPVFINDLLPSDTRQRYQALQLLKATGCTTEAVLYTYSTGNNKGNYHFVWLIPFEKSADEIQSQNASIVPQVR